jgi:hypothetical protein
LLIFLLMCGEGTLAPKQLRHVYCSSDIYQKKSLK